MNEPDDKFLHCPVCGQVHGSPLLRAGQRAICVRCGTIMAERGRLGRDAALAFAVAGLLLAVPALLLPFVVLDSFGDVRVSMLTGGFTGLWSQGFAILASWVLFCGTIAPFGLLALLVAVLWTDRQEHRQAWNREARRAAHFVAHWAMPEVQVLGVLVAFVKLGGLVDATIGPGLWCYAGASLFTLLAWRRLNLQPRQYRVPSAATRGTS